MNPFTMCRSQRQRLALSAGIVFAFTVPVAAQHLPLEQTREAEKQALLQRHRALIAPQALPPETFLAWAADVHLEESARQSFEELVEGYRIRIPPLQDELRAEILERYPASFEYDREAREVAPTLSPELIELYELHDRLVNRLLDLERPVVAALLAPLDPAGQSRIERAWLARLRRLRGLTAPEPEAAILDPLDLIDRLPVEELDLSQVEPVVSEYRRDMIALLEGGEALSPIDLEAGRARLELELGPEWELFFEPDEVAEMSGRLHQTDRPRLIDRAAELNGRLIADVAPLLPPRQSIELRSLYFQRLLPDFFDEEREMLALADTIRALIEGLEGEDAVAAREGLDRGLAAAAEELDITAEAAVALSMRSRDAASLIADRAENDRAAAARSAAAALASERDLLDVRMERRRILGRMLDAIQTAAQHSPEYASLREMFEEVRRAQRRRDEADQFRRDALGARIDGLESLAREIEDSDQEERRDR